MLFVILARAGSKRIPGKNTIDLRFCGKSLVEWAAVQGQEIALALRVPSMICVSSDHQPTLDLLQQPPLHVVPVVRPAELAGDDARSADGIRHAVAEIRRVVGFHAATVCLLQPSNPLRDLRDCVEVIEYVRSGRCQSAYTARASGAPDGNCYTIRTEALLAGFGMQTEPTYRVFPTAASVDIDTPEDLRTAETLFIHSDWMRLL